MTTTTAVLSLFAEAKREHYDFGQAPTLVTLRSTTQSAATPFQGEDLARWQQAQQLLLRWTTDRQIFTEDYIKQGKELYERYFQTYGLLTGNVLDIGGGWGLYRQWWHHEAEQLFVVHDPGVERFLRGPHELHRKVYAQALAAPMTFVEGFGEDLPYQPITFDAILIASALDHCVNPLRVFTEAYRTLRPGGRLLIFQQCQGGQKKRQGAGQRSLGRLLGLLQRPGRIIALLRTRLFYKERHLHNFTREAVIALLEAAHYTKVEAELVPGSSQIYAFEARKL